MSISFLPPLITFYFCFFFHTSIFFSLLTFYFLLLFFLFNYFPFRRLSLFLFYLCKCLLLFSERGWRWNLISGELGNLGRGVVKLITPHLKHFSYSICIIKSFIFKFGTLLDLCEHSQSQLVQFPS